MRRSRLRLSVVVVVGDEIDGCSLATADAGDVAEVAGMVVGRVVEGTGVGTGSSSNTGVNGAERWVGMGGAGSGAGSSTVEALDGLRGRGSATGNDGLWGAAGGREGGAGKEGGAGRDDVRIGDKRIGVRRSPAEAGSLGLEPLRTAAAAVGALGIGDDDRDDGCGRERCVCCVCGRVGVVGDSRGGGRGRGGGAWRRVHAWEEERAERNRVGAGAGVFELLLGRHGVCVCGGGGGGGGVFCVLWTVASLATGDSLAFGHRRGLAPWVVSQFGRVHWVLWG